MLTKIRLLTFLAVLPIVFVTFVALPAQQQVATPSDSDRGSVLWEFDTGG